MRSVATVEEAGPPLDVRRVLEVLNGHGVDYLIVGGLAARLYGAERLTKDIDLVPRSDAANLDRLAGALRELGAFLRVGGLSDEEARALPTILDLESLARMEISTWRTDAGDLDVLRDLRDGDGRLLGYDDLVGRSSSTSLGGVQIRLSARSDIVASKRFADREKDRAALPELERLLDSSDD